MNDEQPPSPPSAHRPDVNGRPPVTASQRLTRFAAQLFGCCVLTYLVARVAFFIAMPQYVRVSTLMDNSRLAAWVLGTLFFVTVGAIVCWVSGTIFGLVGRAARRPPSH